MAKKTKKEITKTIINGLMWTGAFYVACSNPYFASRALPRIIKHFSRKIKNKKEQKKYYDTFYRLKKEGMINIEYVGKQMYISLSEEGKKKAGKYKIDDLKILRPKKWDSIWRILIFDIKDKHKIKREALRGKLKEWNLFQLQKSVWVCPYDFQREVDILRSFFNLKKEDVKIIIAQYIEDEGEIKKHFNLR